MRHTKFLAVISMLLVAGTASAWDCSNPANYYDKAPGNECYMKGTPPSFSAAPQNNQSLTNQSTNNNISGSKSNAIANGGTATGGSVGAITNTAQGGQGGAGGSSNQTQSQTQTQSSASTATTGGVNNQLTWINPRNAPAAFSGGTNTTSDCYHSIGFGVSSIFGGVSFGRGNKSKDCFRVTLANEFYARGSNIAGNTVMCHVTEVVEALGNDCLIVLNEADRQAAVVIASTPQIVSIPPDYVTQEQFARVIKKVLTK